VIIHNAAACLSLHWPHSAIRPIKQCTARIWLDANGCIYVFAHHRVIRATAESGSRLLVNAHWIYLYCSLDGYINARQTERQRKHSIECKTRVFSATMSHNSQKILIADYFWHWGGCDDWINGIFILSGLRLGNYCRRAILRQYIMAGAKGQKSHDIGIKVGSSQRESETFSPEKGKKRFLLIIDIYVLGAPYTFEPN